MAVETVTAVPSSEELELLESEELRLPKIESIIACFKKQGRIVLSDKAMDVLNVWLKKTVVKNRTTKAEIIEIFGEHFLDLNRPKRDSIVSIQYSTGRYGNMTTLQFDLNPETDVVTRWAVGHAICGFCPHVFVNERDWHLEGKMLAGSVGLRNEGSDVMLLPRLEEQEGTLSVKLSNLAVELDYIDHVELGTVAIDMDEELDVGADGNAFAWRPALEIHVELQLGPNGRDEWSLPFSPSLAGRVVVLEVRNSTEFEDAMRSFVLGDSKPEPDAELHVQFDTGQAIQISPIGTKFYRRIVLAVPVGAKSVSVKAPHLLWLLRRAWVGSGRLMTAEVQWQSSPEGSGPIADIATSLSRHDGQRICLEPMQEIQLHFPSAERSTTGQRMGYLLRMSGYCDFERNPGGP